MNLTHHVTHLNAQRFKSSTRRGLIPAVTLFSLIVLAAGLVTQLRKTTYQAESKILFKLDRVAALTGLEKAGEAPLTPLTVSSRPLQSEVQVVTSYPLLSKTIEALQLQDPDGQSLKVSDFLKNLDVNVIHTTDVLQLTYSDSNPDQAADVLNTLVDIYRADRIKSTQRETISAREFIDQQLPSSAEKVRAAESKLRAFKEENGTVNLELETNAAVEALTLLQREQATLNIAIQEKSSMSETLGNDLQLSVSEALTANNLSQSSRVQTILEQLDEVGSEIASQQVEFTEESPLVSDLIGKETALAEVLSERVYQLTGMTDLSIGFLQMGETQQKLIEQYLENDIQLTALKQRLAAVEASTQNFQNKIQVYPALEQQQRNLERQISAAQDTYQSLLNTRQQLQVRENQITDFIEVIEPASLPEKPHSTGNLTIIAMGVVLGLAGAIAVIVAVDFLDIDFEEAKDLYDPNPCTTPSEN